MTNTFKLIVKNAKGETLYKTNEMSSRMLHNELDWLSSTLNTEGLTIIIKPIKGENVRRRRFPQKNKWEEWCFERSELRWFG